jgi:hypothetical protein
MIYFNHLPNFLLSEEYLVLFLEVVVEEVVVEEVVVEEVVVEEVQWWGEVLFQEKYRPIPLALINTQYYIPTDHRPVCMHKKYVSGSYTRHMLCQFLSWNITNNLS